MNYELAKKLKEAGFPIREVFTYDGVPVLPDLPHGQIIIKNLVIPTLSELIEACEPHKADDFDLCTYLDKWEARLIYHGYFPGWNGIPRDDDDFVSIDIKCEGSTPEEAVANLWLALNEKKDDQTRS